MIETSDDKEKYGIVLGMMDNFYVHLDKDLSENSAGVPNNHHLSMVAACTTTTGTCNSSITTRKYIFCSDRAEVCPFPVPFCALNFIASQILVSFLFVN